MSILGIAGGDIALLVVTAATGLIGALIGGRLALRASREASEADLQHRREQDAVEVRAAARLVRDDLTRTAASIRFALDDGKWIDEQIRPTSWDAHAGTLARALRDDDWHAVRGAIIDANHQARDLAVELSATSRGLSPEATQVVLEHRQENVEAARGVLLRYCTIGELLDQGIRPR